MSGSRIKVAARAAMIHLLVSVFVVSLLILGALWCWYPNPYRLVAGGYHLMGILVAVDVVCGPLLTLVLFNPLKGRRETMADMLLIAGIQLAALVYGVNTAFEARPLYLVHEVDRFRVISHPDYLGVDVKPVLEMLPPEIAPRWYRGPVTVGIREPANNEERQTVMLDSVSGGRDYSQRPDFYIPYDDTYRPKVVRHARPLRMLIERYPQAAVEAAAVLQRYDVPMDKALFLPVQHKQDWVVVMDQSARILGFLPHDGFALR